MILASFIFSSFLARLKFSNWSYACYQEFGHSVRLATHANFRDFVKSAGVDFYPLGGDPRVLAGCKRFMACKFLILCLSTIYTVVVVIV